MANTKYKPNQQIGDMTLSRYHGSGVWTAVCVCGSRKKTRVCDLVTGKIVSCGCRKRRVTALRNTKHGESKRSGRTPEMYAWLNMKQRCYNKKRADYQRYGGRGITVCQRWLNSFENFLSDMGRRPSAQHTLERKNNSRGYSQRNCVWATRSTQARNTRRSRIVAFNGLRMTVVAWAEHLSISYWVLIKRLNKVSVREAFTKPYKKRNT